MKQLLKWVFSILFLKMILILVVVANIKLEAQIVGVIQIINEKPKGLGVFLLEIVILDVVSVVW